MVKKRTIRKRINKRKVKNTKSNNTKSNNSNNNNNNHQTSMSRLEYEQSMMDPRFRAAMMGFNHPIVNNNENERMRNIETKNNQLIKQLTVENDINQAKQRELQLKNEIAQQKFDNQSKLTQLQIDLNNERYNREIDALKVKNEQMTKQQEYNNQIQNLNNIVETHKRTIQEEQTRHKQQEELLKTEHENKL